jgi:hypothetical protein
MGFLFLLVMLLSLVSSVAFIWLLVLAFRESVLWGLGVLFVPFFFIFFAIKYWDGAKRPFLIYTGSAVTMVIVFVAMGGMMIGSAAAAASEEMTFSAGAAPAISSGESSSAAQPPRSVPQPAGAPSAATQQRELPGMPSVRGPVYSSSSDLVAAASSQGALSYNEIPVRQAGNYVGQSMRIHGTDGTDTHGRLKSAEADVLVFERHLGSGTFAFEVPKNEIQTLKVLDR